MDIYLDSCSMLSVRKARATEAYESDSNFGGFGRYCRREQHASPTKMPTDGADVDADSRACVRPTVA